MSNLLAIYNDNYCCQVSLSTPSYLLYEEQALSASTSQASILMDLLQKIYIKAKNPKIDVIIAPKGPGSFTSIRVLLATAHGLAFGHQARLFCPTHFDIFEYYYQNIFKKPMLVALSSRRGDYFVQTYPNKEPIKCLNLEEIISHNIIVITDEILTIQHKPTPSHLTNAMCEWYKSDNFNLKPWDGEPFYFNTPSYKQQSML